MFSPAYKRYVLGVMTSVYMLNLLDRGLMGLLLQPIKEDLQLSDTQLGFVTGIAFALFYATLGIPISRWADRGNRVTIAAVAIALWGVTVMACVFVTSYVQLVFARIAAAVGESGCKPPTYSLVGDYFPQAAERTRAMSVYWLGSPFAGLISFIVGGWLNDLYGWRMTFFLMGIPGLVLALLVRFTIAEPRTFATGVEGQQRQMPSMAIVLAALWRQRSLRHLSIGLILIYLMGLGMSPWYAAFMIRSHGMAPGDLGVALGLISFSAMAGILLGGYVANRWFADNERGQVRLTAMTVALLVPCFAAFVLVRQQHEALLAFWVLLAVFNFFPAPTYALMQRLVPDEMRATTLAVVMLLANLIGMGIGSQLVGVISDLLLPIAGNDSLRYSMLIMSSVALWSAYHFWRVGRTVKEDLALALNRGSAAVLVGDGEHKLETELARR